MYGLAENYLVPFALLFNATILQVSFISASNQLGIGIGQLMGAKFVNYFPKYRKTIPVICNILHASSWLLIFFLTIKTKNVYFIIIFYFLGVLSTNFGGPSWVSWMNDIVPEKLRGMFWGQRNRILGIFQFIGIITAGLLLFFFKRFDREIAAFSIVFTAAFMFRFSSIYPLKKQYAPQMTVPVKGQVFRFRIFLTKLTTTNFGKFSLFCFFITFSVNLMAPLIPVYVLKSLGFNYIQYTMIIMLSLILSFVFMNYWGPLSDKYGNHRILFITSIGLPLLSLMWILLRNFYLLCILQTISGFIWAGFNLSMTNFIFDAVRKENISKIMAYFNALNNFSAFLGSIICGFAANFIDHYIRVDNKFFNKFIIIFLISSLLRIIIIILFKNRFKEVRSVELSPPATFFYIFKPINDFINRIQFIDYNIRKQFKKK
ncbi:MAG: MFS transporter [Spirochaetes bacterium]|nr:MFS transporter [Spirochaetota bacterium]